MKKWFTIGIMSFVMLLTGCGLLTQNSNGTSDSTSDSTPPVSGAHTHADGDHNGYCDECKTLMHTHKDEDKNGKCDVCSVATQATIDLYSINDMHGKFNDTYANIGVDELTTYLRNVKAANENTFFLSAGDMWQGSAESNFTKGNIVTEWMNELDFVSMTVGNHEFDWGESYIEENAALAEFPFLGINVYDRKTYQRVEYCQPSVMVEQNGIKIGVIGAIGDCYSSIANEQVEDVRFLIGSALTDLVKEESQKLRAEGADVIVYSVHDAAASNANYYDESLSNGYVDLVFEGHSHTVVQSQDAYGVWHLQAGGDNTTGISHARLTVDLLGDDVTVEKAEIVRQSAYQNLADDPVVAQLLDKYASELSQVNEYLGENDSYRDYDALANYSAQGLYEAGLARWGSDSKYAGKIVLGGGFINVRSPYYLPSGAVKYGDLYTLFPFDNPIVLCSVSGKRLKEQFINSTNYYNYYGAEGEAIKNNVVDSETYYVVVDTYCANYNFKGYGFLNIVEYYDDAHAIFPRDTLAELIKNGGMSASQPTNMSTIPELLAIGNALADNAETAEKYRVVGKVTSIVSSTYGNMMIADDDGNELYVYGTYDVNGNRYDVMLDQPQVGEWVTLEGVMKKYVKGSTVTVEMFEPTVIKIETTDPDIGDNGGNSGDDTLSLTTLSFASGFGGKYISEYDTGNYAYYKVDGVTFEFYRAYKPSSASYLFELLPYISSATDGTVRGSLYNTTPIYGIRTITLTYKTSATATLYTGDDRVASMTAHTLPQTSSYQTKTLTIDDDNFFKLDSGSANLYVKALSVGYTNETRSYNAAKKSSGTGDIRLNAVTYSGTLVAGRSAVSVPVKITYDGGSYQIAQTKTYTYYTLEYVEANPEFADEAAMLTPADVAAYYAAFQEFPANYAAKNFDEGNAFSEVKAVFGDDTRYVSEYNRTDGYATAVPYRGSAPTYYEFDIALNASYWEEGERGVGRVVSWGGGWNGTGYDSAPVSVYTDDHYATFQEYLNTGEFGERFDAEQNLTFTQWSAPTTVTAS